MIRSLPRSMCPNAKKRFFHKSSAKFPPAQLAGGEFYLFSTKFIFLNFRCNKMASSIHKLCERVNEVAMRWMCSAFACVDSCCGGGESDAVADSLTINIIYQSIQYKRKDISL